MAQKEKMTRTEKSELRIRKKAAKKRKRLEKKANKKPMNPVLRIILATFFGIILVGMLTAGAIGIRMLGYIVSYRDGDSVIDLESYTDAQNRTSILYAFDSNGEKVEIGRLHGTENREWVKINRIPETLQQAFIALEDKRFYEHEGVDWIRTVYAFVSQNNQGGSTLTQQLIKNLTGQNTPTFVRKFSEICKALNLEKNYEKKDILEAYLNTIYLGSGCYGVKTAAETYFGKSLKKLNIAECALLASVTQNPYRYNLYSNYDEAKARQKYCLQCMYEQELITKKQYKAALKTKINIIKKTAVTQTAAQTDEEYQSYYVDYVIDEIIRDLMKKYDYDSSEAWQQVYGGGLKIETAVDLDVQEIAENVMENRTDFPWNARDKYGKLPEASVTIMDYKGRVVAIVGGTGKKTGNRVKNRAASSFRQPGSSIKPLSVYGPCVDLGYIASGNTAVLNKAITLPNGTVWPRNYAGDYGSGQNILVRTAVAQSLNTTAARLLYETLGVNASYQYCTEKFHLEHLTAYDRDLAPLAVGGTNGGISTLEMAAAYATFGNGGRYYHSYSYYRVLDKDGKVILDNTNPEPEQALSENASITMLDILTEVTRSGTAAGCGVYGLQTFAKTGTTTENYDKWMCIGTPYYVMSMWYGYDYNANLGNINLKAVTRTLLTRIHSGLDTSRTFYTVRSEAAGEQAEEG